MKASELRIGNLVYVSDNETNIIFKEITPINIHNLMHLTGWDKSPVDIEFEPIPLTEEWLIKFGFKQTFISKIHLTFSKGSFHLLKRVNHIQIWYESIDVKYIHQLQNLYFALTSEELKYEEQF
jgi:hypothetical protein